MTARDSLRYTRRSSPVPLGHDRPQQHDASSALAMTRRLVPLLLAVLLAPEARAQEMALTKLPKLTTRVDAIYPRAALEDRIEAVVELELDLGTEERSRR